MNQAFCGRVGCPEPAIAVLLMSPQDTQAWIVAPDHEYAPEGVPLCPAHADRISVPFGWTLADHRPAPKKKRRRKKPVAVESEPRAEASASAEASDIAEAAGTSEVDHPEPVAEAALEPEPDPNPPRVEPKVAAPEVEIEIESSEASAEAAKPTADDSASIPEPELDVAPEAGYVAPEYQFREDSAETVVLDEPTMQMPAIDMAPGSPSEVPLDAHRVAVAVDDDAPRLSVVPGDDDPQKTYDFSDEGQGAFWHEPEPADADPDETTPLLQRAFRVVRDD